MSTRFLNGPSAEGAVDIQVTSDVKLKLQILDSGGEAVADAAFTLSIAHVAQKTTAEGTLEETLGSSTSVDLVIGSAKWNLTIGELKTRVQEAWKSDDAAQVTSIQARLANLGLYAAKAHGIWDWRTIEAISFFHRKQNIPKLNLSAAPVKLEPTIGKLTQIHDSKTPPEGTVGTISGEAWGREATVAKSRWNTLARPVRRVLVTGFHDWEANYKPGTHDRNEWQCFDNPSGRLLLGKRYQGTSRPTTHEGALVNHLNENAKMTKSKAPNNADLQVMPINWTFQTMPTIWGAADALMLNDYEQYDVIVSIGLGVYDKYTDIFLEYGAHSGCAGEDATGQLPPAPQAAGAQASILEPSSWPIGMADRFVSFMGGALDKQELKTRASANRYETGQAATAIRLTGGYHAQVMFSRRSNDYICNNTHYTLLGYLQSSLTRPSSRLRQVFCVHIPYPGKEFDFASQGRQWSTNRAHFYQQHVDPPSRLAPTTDLTLDQDKYTSLGSKISDARIKNVWQRVMAECTSLQSCSLALRDRMKRVASSAAAVHSKATLLESRVLAALALPDAEKAVEALSMTQPALQEKVASTNNDIMKLAVKTGAAASLLANAVPTSPTSPTITLSDYDFTQEADTILKGTTGLRDTLDAWNTENTALVACKDAAMASQNLVDDGSGNGSTELLTRTKELFETIKELEEGYKNLVADHQNIVTLCLDVLDTTDFDALGKAVGELIHELVSI